MAKVIFEYLEYQDKDEIKRHVNASEYYSDLNDIYNMVRSYLKHNEITVESATALLEKIKEISYLD